jgi:hypothetical protein
MMINFARATPARATAALAMPSHSMEVVAYGAAATRADTQNTRLGDTS